jgi:hypothetical protein
MNTSEAINEIAAALAKAQAKIGHAAKDKDNPHFRAKYADLASIRDACQQALAEAGIAVIQAPGSTDDGCVSMTTRLAHSSGQWFESFIACRPAKADAQAFGSVCTYLRKYSLAAMVGVAPDDDDGEAAVGRGNGNGHHMQPQAARQPAPQQRGRSEPTPFDDGPPAALDDDPASHSAAVVVEYVASNNAVSSMPIDKALAKLWAAHRSKIGNTALLNLLGANEAWATAHAPKEYAQLCDMDERAAMAAA